MGIHDAPNGQLRFVMTHGAMTGGEARQMQENLNAEQPLFERPE
jgi:hypothetical protein